MPSCVIRHGHKKVKVGSTICVHCATLALASEEITGHVFYTHGSDIKYVSLYCLTQRYTTFSSYI